MVVECLFEAVELTGSTSVESSSSLHSQYSGEKEKKLKQQQTKNNYNKHVLSRIILTGNFEVSTQNEF